MDDVPLAGDDHESVKEAESVDGSVLYNDDHGKDGPGTFGENGPAVRWQVPDGASREVDAKGRPFYKVDVDEGTASLYDDGSYIFTAKDLDADTQVSFGYAIVDADGDEAPATLTIDVKTNRPGITPGDVTPDPDDPTPDEPTPDDTTSNTPAGTPGHMILNEGALPAAEGQSAGTGQAALSEHGYKGTGVIHVDLNDDTSGSIQVGTVKYVIEDGTAKLAEGSKNSLATMGVEITVGTPVFNKEKGTWDVTYEYKLTKAQEHRNEEAAGEQDPLDGKVHILVKDASGDKAEADLTIEVHDDAPLVALAEGIPQTVTVDLGADQDGIKEKVEVFEENSPEAMEWTPLSQEGGKAAADIHKLSAGEYVSGNYILTKHEDGSYSFRFKEASPTEDPLKDVELTVRATDSDGDWREVPVTLNAPTITLEVPKGPQGNIPGAGPGKMIVEEAALATGSGKTDYGITGQGEIGFDLKGDIDGSLNIGGDAGFTCFIREGKIVDKNGSPLTNVNQPLVAVNGVIVTITGVSFDPDTHKGVVEYSYLLTGNQFHDRLLHDTALGEEIAVTVTDASGDRATGKLTVEVRDDAPQAEDITVHLSHHSELKGNVLDNDHFNADGRAENGYMTWDVKTFGTEFLSDGDTYSLEYDGFTVELHADGRYEISVTDTSKLPEGGSR